MNCSNNSSVEGKAIGMEALTKAGKISEVDPGVRAEKKDAKKALLLVKACEGAIKSSTLPIFAGRSF